MEIDILREFIELAKDLGFNRTARRLNMSQSALSAHISKLETELNVKLLKRGSTNALTPEGKIFLEGAETIVSTYDDTKKKCRESYDKRATVVRVHKVPAPIDAGVYLTKELFAFAKANPQASIRLIEDVTRTTSELLAQGEVDLGFISIGQIDETLHLKEQGIVCFPFHSEETVIWMSRDCGLVNKEPLEPKDLDGYTFVSEDCSAAEDRCHSFQLFSDYFGIECRSITRSTFSTDEFYLSDFKANELVIGAKSRFANTRAVEMRNDMVLRGFTEPINGVARIGYRTDNKNPALSALVDWLKEHAYMQASLSQTNDTKTALLK